MSDFRIIIVGAGIGGLATAIALRAPGRQITLLESSSMNREIGAAISFQPNATKIIEKWGIDDELMKVGQVDRAFKIYATSGKLQMNIPLKRSDYDADRVMWHRVDLHDTLKRLATSTDHPRLKHSPPAEIRVSSKVLSVDPEAGVVTLADGKTLDGDLIIGADGIHSKVRTAVIGSEKVAQPTGLSAYRLMVPVDRVRHIPEVAEVMEDMENPATVMVVGHDCRIIMGPCRKSTLLGIVGLVPDAKMHEQSSSASWTAPGTLEDLLESFGEYPEWIKETFKQADKDGISLWQIRDLDPLDTWFKGRTLLIGDAAHAMLMTQGQGASQSIEDAEAVGTIFEDYDHKSDTDGSELRNRLERIFRARYERASLIQAYSRLQAKPGTAAKGSTEVTMNPKEFMDYNCRYNGVQAWLKEQALE